MIEMSLRELEQVSGGGGRGGLSGDFPEPHPTSGVNHAASLLGRKPGVSPGGVDAVALTATTLGGRGGISGDV